MAHPTYPAKEYASITPLLVMERGGFKRYCKNSVVVWYFKTPDGSRVHEIEDSLVPTIDNKPVITLGDWHLDRVIWTRLT